MTMKDRHPKHFPLADWPVILCAIIGSVVAVSASGASAADVSDSQTTSISATQTTDTRPASRPSGKALPTKPTSAPADLLSPDVATLLVTAQKAVDAKPGPPPPVLKIYVQAVALLKKAQTDLAKTDSLLAETRAVPARLEELRAELKRERPSPPIPQPVEASLADIEQAYLAAKAQLESMQDERIQKDALYLATGSRLADIPDEVSRAKKRLNDVCKDGSSSLPEDSPVGFVAATKLLRDAAICEASTSLRWLEAEREHAGPARNILHEELSLSSRKIDRLKAMNQKLAAALRAKERKQGLDLQRQATTLQKQYADRHQVLQDLASENVALATQITSPDSVGVRLQEINTRIGLVQANLATLQIDYERMQARLQLTGLTDTIGNLLLEQRDSLLLRRALQARLAAHRTELPQAQIQSFQVHREYEMARRDGSVFLAAMKAMEFPEGTRERARAQADAWHILDLRRKLLMGIAESCTKYELRLSQTIAAEQQLLELLEEITSFIEEQVLWVRNMPPLRFVDIQLAAHAFLALGKNSTLAEIRGDIKEEWQASPVLSVSLLLFFPLLVVVRFLLKRRISLLGRNVSEDPPGTFRTTLKSLLWTLVSAAGWPALLCLVSWRLRAVAPSGAATEHLSLALLQIAFLLLPVLLIRGATRRNGLAAAHLKWDPVRLAVWWKMLSLVLLGVFPLVFLCLMMDARPTDEERRALSRLVGITGTLLLTVLMAVTLRRSGRIARSSEDDNKDSLFLRYWWLLYTIVIVVPLALIGLSAAGYAYSAWELGSNLSEMFFVIMGMLILRDTALRGLWLLRRESVRREIRRRREAKQEKETQENQELEHDLFREAVEQVRSVSDQTARLVRYAFLILALFALYFIWEDMLPAFRFLNRTTLYATGDVNITLAGILSAVVAAVLCTAAARSLPGMLDVYVFARIGFDDGARYAISTLLRYTLIVVGIIVVGAYLGLSWGGIQWIVAAMGIGLGFGLQEIVANFVSGLVLLTERPIRVGDVVTVGESIGRVTSIRIRATTVTDWDHKELVIPNKEFITGRVINWTLSEQLIRLVIPVGVAYSTDTQKAEDVLLRVGRNNEFVLDDPPVKAVLLGFGSSSLDFQLHTWLPNMDHWLEVRNGLHRAIVDAFREEGITIAFPQMDMHFDPRPSDIQEAGGNH